MSEHDLQLQNVVCMVDLGVGLPVRELLARTQAVYCRPNRFSTAVLRLRNPRTTMLIFENGRAICVGNRGVWCALANVLEHVSFLRSIGLRARARDVQIINKVWSFSWFTQIDREKLAADNSFCCTYTPESFPAVEMSVDDVRAPVRNYTCFHTGSVIVITRPGRDDVAEHVNSFLVPKLAAAEAQMPTISTSSSSSGDSISRISDALGAGGDLVSANPSELQETSPMATDARMATKISYFDMSSPQMPSSKSAHC